MRLAPCWIAHKGQPEHRHSFGFMGDPFWATDTDGHPVKCRELADGNLVILWASPLCEDYPNWAEATRKGNQFVVPPKDVLRAPV